LLSSADASAAPLFADLASTTNSSDFLVDLAEDLLRGDGVAFLVKVRVESPVERLLLVPLLEGWQ